MLDSISPWDFAMAHGACFVPVSSDMKTLIPPKGCACDEKTLSGWRKRHGAELGLVLGMGITALDFDASERDFVGEYVSEDFFIAAGDRIICLLKGGPEESAVRLGGRDINILATGFVLWHTISCGTKGIPQFPERLKRLLA